VFNKTRLMRITSTSRVVLALVCTGMICYASSSIALLGSLKSVPIPKPLDLGDYVNNEAAAAQLGKALFWDMQVGSDGVQACASCHFHAGADNRITNQINPGLLAGDDQFGNNNIGLPAPALGSIHLNQTLTAMHFPLHKVTNQHLSGDPLSNPGNVLVDSNDVVSSQGVELMQFVDIVPGNPVDIGTSIPDAVFNINGTNIRRVEPRNTPTNINAIFNFENLHDGSANNIFNGNNAFGPADPRQHLISNGSGSLATEMLRLRQSSLASQALGPPLNDTEMSWRGRTWPKIGKKMLSLTPLAQQAVSGTDSMLGELADTSTGAGLTTSYAALIRAAFPAKYWDNTMQKVIFDLNENPIFQTGMPLNTDEYTQMEANFGFFFGLAVQMYQATLVSDNSRFDLFLEGVAGFTNEEIIGMNVFTGSGGCIGCHDGGVMMDNDTLLIQGKSPVSDIPISFSENPIAANEFMLIATGLGLYDNGFHNTGVRPGGNTDPLAADFLGVNEDIGRGGTTSLGGAFTEISLSKGILGLQETGGPTPQIPSLSPLPAHMAGWVPPLPLGFLPGDTTPYAGRVTNFGAFKTPGLRNVALTGPYMHNGGLSTLRQVTDFYVRGGDFSVTNAENFDTGMIPLGLLRDEGAIPGLPTPEQMRDGLTRFMTTLTDSRVANEEAPFDHPEIFVPITGTAPVSPGSRTLLLANATDFQQVPAVGRDGRSSIGLPKLGTFLGLNPIKASIFADVDRDLIADIKDNCSDIANPGQEDGDGDAYGDACDNCTAVANTDQRDTDADSFGNLCDADLDNSGVVNLRDFSRFRAVFGQIAPLSPAAENADFNGDGRVNLRDFSIFRSMFGKAPGP